MPYEGISALFQRLIANLQLTSEQVADAAGKHQRVRRALNSSYWSTDSGTANSMLIGSYGKDTEIRPPSDVDILFELPWSVYQRYQDRTGNKQSQLLQEVKGVLEQTFATTRMRGDGQVVVVPFTSYAVEVLPAFKMSSNYWYPDTNGGGSWQTADPQAELTALRVSNSLTGGKTIHLVKMLKAWRNERNVSIKSFVLELLAVDFLHQWGYNRTGETYTSYGYYDFMLRDFFPFLLTKENGYVSIPGTGQLLSLGNAWVAQARIAANAASRATDHGGADRLDAARAEWRNLFGYFVS